ncbi:MAG: choice-of-anchor J domain-containing protein, partial [Bacteroidales bacterium]|nr:choice-of-anchor J domain-containing protein [Bacteroidales bacterium]
MKRIFYFLLAMIFAIQSYSQATLNEGFEGTTFPPDDWTKVTTQGTEAWERYTSDAPRGLACASVNYDDPSHINYLITPKLIVSSDQDSIVYWVKTSYDWGGTTLNVLVSTTDNAVTSFSTTSLQTVSTLSESWVRKSIPLTNYIGEEIYIAFQVVDDFGSRVMLDDVTGPELFVPACPRPRALTVSNPTTIGIDLGWTDDTGSIWNIEYMLATETDWTNATTLYSVMNPHTFTSLNASTSYKARVQTDCGTEQSDWTSPITFMTACDAITVLPYSDSFDTYGTVSGSFPPCWSRPVLNTTTPFPSIHTTNHSSPASIKFQSASATQPTYVITPQFADDINTLRIKFWLRAESTTSSGAMEIGVMSDPLDLTTFELVATINPSTTAWTEYEYLFSGTTLSGPNNYIAFKHVTSASNYYYWLDDVTVDYIPSCPKPTALTASNPTTIGIDLGWTDDVGSLWNIQYMLNSETDWANSTTISGVSNPYTFTTLNPSTVYKARVQTDCGTEQSEWSSIITFVTGCDVITIFPWTEGFESDWSPAVAPGNKPSPNCWTVIDRGGTNGTYQYWWKKGTTPAHSGGGHAVCYTDYGTSSHNDWLITPQIALTGNERLRFWAMRSSSTSGEPDEISIFISEENTILDTTGMGTYDTLSGFTRIFNQLLPSANWQQYELDLNQYSGNRYIAFVRQGTPDGYNLRLDDVEISELPTCIRPTNVIVSNITTTDAEVSWTNGNSADAAWWIYYKQSSASTYDSVLVNSNPYTFTTLLPSSGYNIYVVTDCSTELSEASPIVNFRTLCADISVLPYLESFDSYGTGSTTSSYPECWTRNVTTYTTNYPYISSTYFSSPGALYFYAYGNTRTVAVANAIDATIPINTLSVEFKMRYSTIYPNGIQVGVMTDPNDFTTFVPVGVPQVISAINTWEDKFVFLSNYTGTGRYIALAAIAPADGYSVAYVDDFKVDLIPSCPNVYGLIAQPATTSSVSVNWNDEGDEGDGYVIAYSPNLAVPFDPTTATTVTIPTGTTLPYFIPGFNAGDSVWVAVQRGCGGTWTTAQKVILPSFAYTLPFTSNFEDTILDTVWTIENGTSTNKWYIGAPGANDSDPTDGIDERGLYISNDNGLTNTYTTSTTTTVIFASTVIEFDNSTAFELSFDWANYGEGSWDNIKVYLLPLGVTLVPGTEPSASYMITPTYLAGQSSYQSFTRALDASYGNAIKRLVFAWKNDTGGGTQPPGRVDNISFVALTCGMPYGLAMDSASYNGTDVYLHWTESQGATDWIVEYQQTGTTAWQQVAANSNPFTLTGLNPGTSYQARVRSICNASDTSAISNVINFQTACIALTVPTLPELFNTVLPSTCWDRKSGLLPATGPATLSSTTSGWSSHSTPIMPNAGNHAYINIWSTGANYWLITPSYDLGDGTSPAQIEFDAILSTYTPSGAPSTAGVDDKFAVVV